jgi:GT2 family glycosyltransferase
MSKLENPPITEIRDEKVQTNSDAHYHVAVVMLNYNSTNDLKISLPQMAAQHGIKLTLIIVDNASSAKEIKQARIWVQDWRPDVIMGDPKEIDEWIAAHPEKSRTPGNLYFILNNRNGGYSAGNNIGLRVGNKLGADAALIVNPDMRFNNSNYVASLSALLAPSEKNCIAASRIIDLNGENQNPLREPGFWEELFWPRVFLPIFQKSNSYTIMIQGDRPTSVPKVSGCCFMIDFGFLRTINYLDENVFLYCEEPILSALASKSKLNIIYDPNLIAVHAHAKSQKENSSKRMLLFIKSRLYYLKKYSDYNRLELILLQASYSVLTLIYKVKIHAQILLKP